jgi:hypothetical protein
MHLQPHLSATRLTKLTGGRRRIPRGSGGTGARRLQR